MGIESMALMLQEPKLLFEQQERYLTEENYKSSNFFYIFNTLCQLLNYNLEVSSHDEIYSGVSSA